LTIALILIFIGFTASALAQDNPADNMEIVKEKVHADKKTLNREVHGVDGIRGKSLLAGL
jgi:hypothetical protein